MTKSEPIVVIRRSPHASPDSEGAGEERTEPAVRGDWFSAAVPGARRAAYRGQPKLGMQ